jgi:hypothetical protein
VHRGPPWVAQRQTSRARAGGRTGSSTGGQRFEPPRRLLLLGCIPGRPAVSRSQLLAHRRLHCQTTALVLDPAPAIQVVRVPSRLPPTNHARWQGGAARNLDAPGFHGHRSSDGEIRLVDPGSPRLGGSRGQPHRSLVRASHRRPPTQPKYCWECPSDRTWRVGDTPFQQKLASNSFCSRPPSRRLLARRQPLRRNHPCSGRSWDALDFSGPEYVGRIGRNMQ